MFGLFMGIALGVGGIVGGIKKAKDLNDIRNWSIGHSKTSTYYDLYKGTDRDIRTNKPVDIVKANNGTGHTLVVDRSSGSVLRNVSLDEKRLEFQYGKKHCDDMVASYKGMLMYDASQIKEILNSYCIHLDRLDHYTKGDENLKVYRHFKTGKFCLKKAIDQELIEVLKKDIRIGYTNAEVDINKPKECYMYFDIETGELLDVEFSGPVIIKYFSKMDNIIKEVRPTADDMNLCIHSFGISLKNNNRKYLTSLSVAFKKINTMSLV